MIPGFKLPHMDTNKLAELESAMDQVKKVIGNLPWELVMIPSPLGFGRKRKRLD